MPVNKGYYIPESKIKSLDKQIFYTEDCCFGSKAIFQADVF